MFGTDFDTPDGTCVRDYVHVTDLANAHVLSLQRASGNVICERYNLGSGVSTSNRQLLETIKKYVGNIKIAEMDRRAGDPPILVANTTRAKTELGWEPRHSCIDNIVQTAVKWYSKINQKDLN